MSYGLDTWCVDGLQTGRFARGSAAVVQALYRRLITPRGKLRGGDEEENYGLDVAGYIGAIGYETALAALPGLIRGELMKDDRVSDLEVSVAREDAADGTIGLTISVTGTLHEESGGFAFSVAASETSLELLGGVAS